MSSKEVKSLKGMIDSITYRNEQNGYTVCRIKSGNKKHTLVGIMPGLNVGDSCVVEGEFTEHPTYGKQFSVKSFEKKEPEGKTAIYKYLSCGAINGIGPSTAEKIVMKFGDESLDILENHPHELTKIKGISSEKANQFSMAYKNQKMVKDVIILLNPFDIPMEKAVIAHKMLGISATDIIKENPYVLCDEEIGISFHTADVMANKFGMSQNSRERIFCGVKEILREYLANGHTCSPEGELFQKSAELLGCNTEEIESQCANMLATLNLVRTELGNGIYYALPDYYTAELYIATRLASMDKRANQLTPVDDAEIEQIELKAGIKFDDKQIFAIKSAFQKGVFILTGGPGTGKTTILRAIISLMDTRSLNVELAAPTGRAAKRMSELTGRPASTIHRLLGAGYSDNDAGERIYDKCEEKPLDCDVLILDEASMVDSLLFEALLRALRPGSRIIIVGDTDQLPSVGAGNVLHDLIKSEKFCSVALWNIFRQSAQSVIVKNAHKVVFQDTLDLSNSCNSDFFFLEREDPVDAMNTVVELVTSRLPKSYKFNPFWDIQVLCPSRKNTCGSTNLNLVLQNALNPGVDSSNGIAFGEGYYGIGDKVMHIKNDYNLPWVDDDENAGAFNGDIGQIVDMDRRAGLITVEYEDHKVLYERSKIEEIELAYAVTVHKSQGCEFPCVIIPIVDVPNLLCYRNLIYTGITRAKRLLILVGKKRILDNMIFSKIKSQRYTMLKDMLE